MADDDLNKIFAYTRDGTRDSSKDFDTLAPPGNRDIEGIWSDGVTMFVVDRMDDKVYAYKMSDTLRDSGKDITLDSSNNNPRGIWGNSDTIWVSEDDTEPDNKIYAYSRSSRSYDSSGDFDTLNGAGTRTSRASGPTASPCGRWTRTTARSTPTRRPTRAGTPTRASTFIPTTTTPRACGATAKPCT